MTDRDGILAACEERDDPIQLAVAADWFDDNDEPILALALRWMAKWDKRPHKLDTDSFPWMWTCYGGLCGPQFKCGIKHTLPRQLCTQMGFHEWRCRPSWEAAVRALGDGLSAGDVDCVGDPLQAESL